MKYVCGVSRTNASMFIPELKKTNDCIDQKTCGDCLAAGPPCGWCFQEARNIPTYLFQFWLVKI